MKGSLLERRYPQKSSKRKILERRNPQKSELLLHAVLLTALFHAKSLVSADIQDLTSTREVKAMATSKSSIKLGKLHRKTARSQNRNIGVTTRPQSQTSLLRRACEHKGDPKVKLVIENRESPWTERECNIRRSIPPSKSEETHAGRQKLNCHSENGPIPPDHIGQLHVVRPSILLTIETAVQRIQPGGDSGS